MAFAAENRPVRSSVKAVDLDWYSDTDIVQVTARGQARFEVQKDHAIHALQLEAADRQRFEKQLHLLFETTAEWIRDSGSLVSDAYLTMRDGRFLFIPIAASAEISDDLEDSLSDLDIEVANDSQLDLILLNTMVLPPASEDALSSFFNDKFVLRFSEREEGAL